MKIHVYCQLRCDRALAFKPPFCLQSQSFKILGVEGICAGDHVGEGTSNRNALSEFAASTRPVMGTDGKLLICPHCHQPRSARTIRRHLASQARYLTLPSRLIRDPDVCYCRSYRRPSATAVARAPHEARLDMPTESFAHPDCGISSQNVYVDYENNSCGAPYLQNASSRSYPLTSTNQATRLTNLARATVKMTTMNSSQMASSLI